jgi:hypothetical protein
VTFVARRQRHALRRAEPVRGRLGDRMPAQIW